MPIVAGPAHLTNWEESVQTGQQTANVGLPNCIAAPTNRSSLVQWLFEKGMRWADSFYASPAAVEIVFDLYSVRDRRRVWAYLELHREVLPVLVNAYSQIQARFGSGTPVVLTVISEPTNRQSTELFALISTSIPVDHALAALRILDEEWWLDVPEQRTGALNLDIEFV